MQDDDATKQDDDQQSDSAGELNPVVRPHDADGQPDESGTLGRDREIAQQAVVTFTLLNDGTMLIRSFGEHGKESEEFADACLMMVREVVNLGQRLCAEDEAPPNDEAESDPAMPA